MLWPTPVDYVQAVGGYPDVCLLDPKLRGGKPKRTPTNQLLVYTGGFSTVFPIEVAHNNHALRCWNRDIGDSKNRYEKTDDYLTQVRLPYFVDFKYVPEGILINGKKWPITRMEWANGESLRDFIKHNLSDSNIFSVVANEFRKMFETLHVNKISHGDLQNGNILLTRNGANVKIKLIDYDSLFVPALRGESSPTPGLPEYQHPLRSDKCDEKMDYFSELVIYLSFLSLSEKPELWNLFKDKTEKGLLFSKDDIENPDQSDIFKELENLSSDVQNLASTLKQFCAKTSIDDLEPLEAILPKHDAKFYTDQGQNHTNKSRYNDAISEFQKALVLNPNYEKALYGLGLAYLHSNRYNEAIDVCEQAIYIEPNYKEAYLVLGFAHLKSGHNSKATIAANEALKIDPYYQPAKQLLDAIKNPPIPPDPPDPSSDFWQSFIRTLGKNWQSITAGALAIGLIICLIAFLTQMNAKGNAFTQNTMLKNQLVQKETQIAGLNTSIQTLESDNESLNKKNKTLQEELENKNTDDDRTSKNVLSLQRQLNGQRNKNRLLQNQLTLKDTEIKKLRNEKAIALSKNLKLQNQLINGTTASKNQETTNVTDQKITLQQLQKEKTEVFRENRSLKIQLTLKTSEVRSLNTQVRQLQKEKTEIQRQNQKLRSENQDVTRQNLKLSNENTVLREELDKNKQSVPNEINEIIGTEPPRKIRNYRNVVTRAGVYSNHGIIAFERKEYDKAITHFRQAIKIDSKFAVAHYNLGCTYLEMNEYCKAVNALDKAVALDLNFKEAYYNRGIAYVKMKKFKDAKQSLKKTLSIDTNYKLAQQLLRAIEKVKK